MKLAGNDLLQEIEAEFARKKNSFPRGGALDYPRVIAGWIGQLEALVFPYVTAGAIAVEGYGHLTMHDREQAFEAEMLADETFEIEAARLLARIDNRQWKRR